MKVGSLRPQFNLQSVMFLTCFVACTTAAVAPAFRTWDAQQRFTFLCCYLTELALVVACFGVYWYNRRVVIAKAGDCSYRSAYRPGCSSPVGPTLRSRAQQLWPMAQISLHVGMVLGMSAFFIHRKQSIIPVIALANPVTVYLGIARFAQAFWDTEVRDVEVCEHGLVMAGLQFLPWDRLVSVRASQSSPEQICLVIATFPSLQQATQTITTSPATRDELLSILRERTTRALRGEGSWEEPVR